MDSRGRPCAPERCSLLEAPVDVVLLVFSFLQPYDLCVVAQVCSSLNALSSEDTLWRQFCPPKPAEEGLSKWKDLYMSWLRPRLDLYAQRQAHLLHSGVVETEEDLESVPKGLKILLLGKRGVGKTSLFSSFSLGQPPAQYTATEDLVWRSKEVATNDQLCTLQILDKGCERRFDRFCQGASGALLVYNVADPDSLSFLETFRRENLDNFRSGTIPLGIVVVGVTRALAGEAPRQRAVSTAEGQKAAQRIGAAGWLEVDCNNAAQVRTAFELVKDASWAMNDAFCLAWRDFKSPLHDGWQVPDQELCRQLFSQVKTKRPLITSTTTPTAPLGQPFATPPCLQQ